ncbi:hypothetical protein [[Limnothrix rosea] IAM M-220]|uniref:hypothetical protein n=1 Tax=[Limnothrix rosea] IAM M-220 TaxID=454133 RepID=UPI000960F8BB|nr:hypothetical protein [[Limnothrix rosea] IAM M-220]OKH19263.1 hypothetical protein NIES208_03145 [[Limnothrix rosea] IAM M-220]
MDTQQNFSSQAQGREEADLLALLFFFLGAPHIYGFLRGRSRRKAQQHHSNPIGLTIASILGTGLISTFAFSVF